MKPGQIYDLFFPFKPPLKPSQGSGKKRPALIMSVTDDEIMIAVVVKITSSSSTEIFPNRIEITHWAEAGLEKQSYVEIDSEILIRITNTPPYRGELVESDFNKVLTEFVKLKTKSIRRSGKTT